MRVFCLTRVESSLVAYVCTASLCVSPSYSDEGVFFTVKYSILIGVFTFLRFVQSQSTRGDLYFLLHAMML